MTQIQQLEASALFLERHMSEHVSELTILAWHILADARRAIEAQMKTLIS